MGDLPIASPAAEMIGTLIDSFVSAIKESADLPEPGDRSAELAYELDQVVSAYLDEHELSAEAYHQIEQDVLNTIAADLDTDPLGELGLELSYDADGNVDPMAVFTALDDQLDDWLANEADSSIGFEPLLDATSGGGEFAADFGAG